MDGYTIYKNTKLISKVGSKMLGGRSIRGYLQCFYFASIIVILASSASCAQKKLDPSEATAKLRTYVESKNFKDIDKIRRLIKAGADVYIRTKDGVAPLWMASQNGHTDIVKLLLEAKADVNAANYGGTSRK